MIKKQEQTGHANSFIADAVHELLTYYTPKAIVDFITSEQIKYIIGNPPYDVKS